MRTALLVIDVQQALVDALAASRRSALLTTIAGLVARARAASVPVIYVRHEDDELVPGTPPWQIAAEIAPRPEEPIVEKRFRDAFRETHLADVLGERSVEHLVVCGMQTEFCVDATIREAERRGYRVTLVADAHATYPAEGLSEEQIRDHVHRVARGRVAAVVPAGDLFREAATNA